MLFRKNIFILVVVVMLLGACGHIGSKTAKEEKTAPPVSMAAPLPQSLDIKNTESLVIVFVVSPDKVKGLVPEPLILSPYNIMYVAVSRTPMEAGFVHSMELGISVTFKGIVYNYPVYRLVDNQKSSELGRIITGAPTPMGDISFTKNGKTLTASAARNGKVLFKATMTLGEEGDALDNAPGVNLKMIAGEENGAPLLKQLVGGKMEKVLVHEFLDGECQYEFAASGVEGLPQVPVRQVFRSIYRKADFTLTSAGVLYDYLKANEQPGERKGTIEK